MDVPGWYVSMTLGLPFDESSDEVRFALPSSSLFSITGFTIIFFLNKLYFFHFWYFLLYWLMMSGAGKALRLARPNYGFLGADACAF